MEEPAALRLAIPSAARPSSDAASTATGAGRSSNTGVQSHDHRGDPSKEELRRMDGRLRQTRGFVESSPSPNEFAGVPDGCVSPAASEPSYFIAQEISR